ncbi:MAG TPA: APC family permease [Jatrophihabitans sp.]|nr:APC family permease [Jatrophihabitans sp.]
MASTATAGSGTGLRRSVGFWGLMFVSLGSIIGSGWLLGALTAATVAGPASLVSWVLAAVMLAVLALIHAELGASYPVAGGTARYPYFAFGNVTGFVAGWSAWLQAVALAPIEAEASITYLESTEFAQHHLRMLHTGGGNDGTLNTTGLIVASLALLLFTMINLLGAKLLSDSNAVAVIWKTAIPVLTVVVLITLSFHASNFHAGGGFAPFGGHGVFAALPAGVVFALQGFEQAVQLAGEAKDPQRDVSRAVITAMLIGSAIYILLEICFIGALNPANLTHGWANPIGKGNYGPYHDLALAAGAGWLAALLVIDAVISPAGTGLVYIGTSSRVSYALGEEDELPTALTKINRSGVPWVSILLAFVVGLIMFLPFPSWQSLVSVVTSATAIMYAFGPVSLAALQQQDTDRTRPYRIPAPSVLLPLGFVFANLIIYWGGFEVMWKLDLAIVLGLVIFAIGASVNQTFDRLELRGFGWVLPWLAGLTVISVLGRYGTGAQKVLPDWIDSLVVVIFGLAIFYYTVRFRQTPEQVQRNIETENRRDEALAELRVPG